MKEVAGSQECYLYVDAVRTLFDLSGNGPEPEGVCVDPAPEAAVDEPADAGAADPPGATDTGEPPGATVHRLRGTGTDNA
jgi:hypothetical protein